MPPDPTPLLDRAPVVPVLTIERAEHAVPLAGALVAGGLPLIEVALRTEASAEAARAIGATCPTRCSASAPLRAPPTLARTGVLAAVTRDH